MPEIKNLQRSSMQKVAFVVTFCIFFFCLSVSFWFYSYTQKHAIPTGKATVIVDIPRGASFQKIQRILVDAGLIDDDIRFAFVAKMIGVSHRLKAGEFELNTEQKPAQLLRQLTQAQPVQHSITVPEGLNAQEIALIFARKGWCSAEDFLHIVYDVEVRKRLGFAKETSLEGYLFPDTYQLTRDKFSAKIIVMMMVNHFSHVYGELAGEKLATSEMRRHIVTLASIVEEEAVLAVEQPRIAGVFANRLQRGMRLQSDPTVLYGVENHKGPITRADLKRKTAYNTYVIKGLPPGPIANPGRGALEAALHPERHKFLYFVADTGGKHIFSTNLRDHNRAVREYRKRMRLYRAAKG